MDRKSMTKTVNETKQKQQKKSEIDSNRFVVGILIRNRYDCFLDRQETIPYYWLFDKKKLRNCSIEKLNREKIKRLLKRLEIERILSKFFSCSILFLIYYFLPRHYHHHYHEDDDD